MSLADLRRNNKQILNTIINKSKKVAKSTTTAKKSGGMYERVKELCDLVNRKLGHLKDEQICIQDYNQLKEYIDLSIQNGYISIDTETTGLDPICDEIVGACIYTPGKKPAYIPINHVSLITGVRLNNQLTNQQVAEQFQRIVDNNVKIIMFNAKFDIRVIRNQLGVYMEPYWDGFIAGKCLKEDEEEANLKYLWTKYCSKDKTAEHFTFEKLFKGYKFNVFPIDTACLYAANDAIITWDLYKFQEPYLTPEDELCKQCGLQKLAKLYREIELPIITAIADIEDNGVCLDTEYIQELSVKYHKLLDEKIQDFNNALLDYKDKLIQYKSTHPSTKLEDPINISSPVQLAELLYDVLQIPSVSKKAPRGTGEEILSKMEHPLCKPILAYREVNKLITTYIDKMAELLNAKTHRLHCSFHQYGTGTGRFSSSDPNLQNIPSHNKDIRPMFVSSSYADVNIINGKLTLLVYDKVTSLTGKIFSQDLQIGVEININSKFYTITNIQKEGKRIFVTLNEPINEKIRIDRKHVLIGSDYSQQEPKLTADLSNDEQFIKDCASGKDAYSTIASIAFEKPYEECLEFRPDGTVNKEGKERRGTAKILLLGICYGKTMKSIAEDLRVTEEKASEIYNAVLRNIPGLKNFMEESEEMARTYGWVETKWGRRRHIPDMQLQPYEIQCKDNTTFDPFFDSKELGVVDDTEKKKQQFYNEIINAKWYKDKKAIKERAEKEGFHIHDNTRFIEDAKRQCVNCVDANTEILTKDGWRTVYNLQKTDIVKTYNINTHKFEWSKLKAINIHNGVFQMYHIKKSGIDCLCTENHNFVLRNTINSNADILKPLISIDKGTTYGMNRHGRFVSISFTKNDIKKVSTRNLVWCPTTETGTWIARRNGTIFITGNSRIQGSAADQTKIAIQNLHKNKELKDCYWKTLLLVHDEIIGECPLVLAYEGGKLLTKCMIDAAKDLRTGAKCDAAYSFRWYGEEIHIDENTDFSQYFVI